MNHGFEYVYFCNYMTHIKNCLDELPSSITVERVLFDFGFINLFNKRLAFPPLCRNFYKLLLVTSKYHWVPRMLYVL